MLKTIALMRQAESVSRQKDKGFEGFPQKLLKKYWFS
jgi:hypothetical protein